MTVRNSFEALSQRADSEDWCWRLGCSTCGHVLFRYGLGAIARGYHPDLPGWVVTKANIHDLASLYGEPRRYFSADEQSSLSFIGQSLKLKSLIQGAKRSEWLGHLGILLHYTERVEADDRRLTVAILPQLIRLLPRGGREAELCRQILESENRVLKWQDLGVFEKWARMYA